MLLFYILDRYWSKRQDDVFRRFWDKWVLGKLSRNLLWMPVHYFLGAYVLSRLLLINSESLLVELLVYLMTFMLYGALYFRSVLRFFAHGNARYLRSQFGMPVDDFDKGNVVYEEKKR